MIANEVILKVGAEGGSVTLYGIRDGDGWRFSRRLIDQTPALIDEPAIDHASAVVRTWSEALELMDRYPWYRLCPIEIHPEFRDVVLQEVLRRHQHDPLPGSRLNDWKIRCRRLGHKFSEGTFRVTGEVSATELKELKKRAKSHDERKP